MQAPYPGISNLYILPNETRGKYVLLAVKICSWLQVLRMIFYIMIARTYSTNGMRSKLFSQLLLADTVIGIPLNLVFPIVLIMWMTRAYYNLHRTGIPNLQYSAGWAVGAWFVPFMNLVRPYKIMKEIWYRKQLNFRDDDHEPVRHSSLRAWWGFYILPAFIGGFFAVILLQATNDLTVIYVFQALVHCGLAISLFALTDVLKKLTFFETEFRDRFLISQTQKVVDLADAYRNEQGISSDVNPSYQAFSVPPPIAATPVVSLDWNTAGSFSRSASFCFLVVIIGSVWRMTVNLISLSNEHTEASKNDAEFLLSGAFMFIVLILGIAATVYFILWLNRVYKNLLALKAENMSVSFGQLSYWWIIPLYNLYILFAMMRDISVYIEQQNRKKLKEETLSSPGILFLCLLLGMLTNFVTMLLDSGRGFSDAEENLVGLLKIITPLAFGMTSVAAIVFMRKVKAFSTEIN